MKNILIISSKKYTKLKSFTDLIKLIESKKLNYLTLNVEDNETYKDFLNSETLVVSFGGDGTALKAMKVSWKHDLLFMPLGTGRVGYLVNKSEHVDKVLSSWISGDVHVDKRHAIIQDNNLDLPAFNEVVLIKNSPTRILDIVFKTYDQTVKLRADGIIISTSLGSTAYNYSAGGPIVHNSLDSIIITPISPFSKFPRSVVFDRYSTIEIQIKKKQNFAVQFDGVVESEAINDKDIKHNYSLSLKIFECHWNG
ncbi:MAG: NAD(+)/NADH kinase [Candidatus Actinomarina sp.]